MSSPFSDKLTIETPELISVEYLVAGVGSRFLAISIDTLIQIILSIIFLIPIAVSGGFESFDLSSWSWSWATAMLVLALFAIQYGYFVAFESLWKGQTPGKRWMCLRAIQDSGRPLRPIDAITRNLIRIVDQLPAGYAIGIASATISRRCKRLGDIVAGTVVVHENPIAQPDTGLGAGGGGAIPPDVALAAARMSAEEARLVAAFMSRREQLDAAVRYDASREIARRLAQRLGLPEEASTNAEMFLESLEQARRQAAAYG